MGALVCARSDLPIPPPWLAHATISASGDISRSREYSLGLGPISRHAVIPLGLIRMCIEGGAGDRVQKTREMLELV